jgi:hypothetical protein
MSSSPDEGTAVQPGGSCSEYGIVVERKTVGPVEPPAASEPEAELVWDWPGDGGPEGLPPDPAFAHPVTAATASKVSASRPPRIVTITAPA